MLKALAFDYGASSGRAMLGEFDGEKLRLKEIHRFLNEPVNLRGRLYWDVLRLFHEMKQGILKCSKSEGKPIASVGVDTWGVDFGLLDPAGELLGNPMHYRDSCTIGMIEHACDVVPKLKIYRKTGIQFQRFNTLYQLLFLKLSGAPLLEKAETLLFMPDLLNYFLTGEKRSEFTIASTSQMMDPSSKTWAYDIIEALKIPAKILADIIQPGTAIGKIGKEICNAAGIAGDIPVIAVAGHDTASAVAAVPATNGNYAYLSSGTWSLLGIECAKPIINSDTYSMNFTNEGGVDGTYRLLKNIMGLWIYQECKRCWDMTGEALDHEQLELLAQGSKGFKCFIDPDSELFYSPGNMPEKVRKYCSDTKQPVPQNKGEVIRCVMESLAFKYRMTIESIEEIAGYKIPQIYMVGGGCKNKMLCGFTANATGREVHAGPVEATAIGNVISQLVGLGEIKNFKEARLLVSRSFKPETYEPCDIEEWDNAYRMFKRCIGQV